ncbi:MAG: ribosome biogenesis GTPase Der [Spirochaetales bacterium]|nr:ribosome biogenesis GTPase Der [Spirochaetales bacterium]
MTSSPSTESDARGSVFTVAILGKPNVGKSTLFNRLVGRRRAITHSTAGVTRDIVEAELWFGDLRCLIRDTGGYNRDSGAIERLVARRSLESAEESDLLLLVVEAAGVSGEDRDFVEKLRRYEDKVILVVNKVDSESQEMALGEFFQLGFRRMIPVSAEANRNLDELREAIYQAARRGEGGPGRPARQAAASEEVPRLTIIGKPNTGKSTLLNRLLGQERAIVSETPGTTRDPVFGEFAYGETRLRVVDTAGIRRRAKVTENVEYYSVNRAIRTLEEADIVLLLVDGLEGLSDQDKKIASLAVRRGRGVVIVLNKWDRMDRGRPALRAAADRVRFVFPILQFAPVVAISAQTGWNVNRMLQEVLELWDQLRRKVPTHQLNRLLQQWVADYPLPVRGRNVKLRYATQTSVNPVRFVFFVNSRKGYPGGYTRYLENRIRQDLGFDKVPVAVEVRES